MSPGEELVAMVVDRRTRVGNVAERIRERVAEENIVTISVGYSTVKKEMSPASVICEYKMTHSELL